MIRTTPTCFALVAGMMLLATGCKREVIRVYVAPKEPPADSVGEHGKAEAQIAWKLPEGWHETAPSKVNFASFAIAAKEGEATVNISQLPDLRGRELLVVNMWREQVGQPPLTEEEAGKALTPVIVAGTPAQSFEVAGTRDGKPMRIVTAMLHRPEASWFFKLAGDEAAVLAHKTEFIEFVKTIRFVEGDQPETAPAAAAPPQPAAQSPIASQFKWTVPEGWQALAPGQMQVAKFSVPEQNGTKAEVAVSIFPSESGGTLANVNRWRQQLGLPAIDEAALKDYVTPLDATPDALLVDLANEQRRMLGAIVPRDGRWWFYKMMGDAAAVAAARESFVAFVKSSP